MQKLSIIVPCFNEELSIPLFYTAVTDVLDSLESDYEIIFVNDGSKDNTLNVIKKIADSNEHIIYLSLSRNFGKESAMYAGFCNCHGDCVAVMDADLQDPPALLPEMIKYLDSGEYDCVATRRSTRKGEPPIRSWFARRFYQLINRISDAEIVDGARDFRMMRRSMVDAIIAMQEYDRFSKGIFGWIGFRTKWLSYDNIERAAGQTKWSFWNLFQYALGGIISFSQAPLNTVPLVGSVIMGISFLGILISLINGSVPGKTAFDWYLTIFIIAFIEGLQLLMLGIVGQYLARTYNEVKKRPHYIISECNIEDPKKIG